MLHKIPVTYEFINDGSRSDPRSCPLALALRSAGYHDIRACHSYIEVDGRFYDVSPAVDEFMEQVDDKEVDRRTISEETLILNSDKMNAYFEGEN